MEIPSDSKVAMDLFPIKVIWLYPCHSIQKIKNLYCVDSCFPEGLNAVAFSGYACAHKIGSKLNINSFNLPD